MSGCGQFDGRRPAERLIGPLVIVVCASFVGGCSGDAATRGSGSAGGSPNVVDSFADDRAAAIAARARNAPFDAQMDALDAALNQQAEQWPSLEAPVDRDNPLVLSVAESQARIDQALVAARGGDFSAALKALSVVRCHPDLFDAWNNLYAEVQAVRFHEDKIFPLAARFAAHSLRQNPRSAAASIRDSLRDHCVWAWSYEGALPVMPMPGRAGAAAGEPRSSFFVVQGYSNRDEPVETAGQSPRPHQVFHFVVFLTTTQRPAMSYIVQSQRLAGGERAYFLERQIRGRPEVLEVYDECPDYARALADVRARIEQPANQGVAP